MNRNTLFAKSYEYDNRMNQILRISEITTLAERKLALDNFIAEEKTILTALTPPEHMSQALGIAKRMLESMETPLPSFEPLPTK